MTGLRRALKLGGSGGQATTEVVFLFPLFMLVMFFMMKIFAILVLVQKLEIASYYAARKWQLESHRNVEYFGADDALRNNVILPNVKKYLGFDNAATRKFLNLQEVKLDVERTQVWNVVTLTVKTSPPSDKLRQFMCRWDQRTVCTAPYGENCSKGYDFLCGAGHTFEVVKYVPNRDRPLKFEIPGSAE